MQNAKSFEELKTVAQNRVCDLGDLDACEARQAPAAQSDKVPGKLADAELESVAGGRLAIFWGMGDFKADTRPGDTQGRVLDDHVIPARHR